MGLELQLSLETSVNSLLLVARLNIIIIMITIRYPIEVELKIQLIKARSRVSGISDWSVRLNFETQEGGGWGCWWFS